MDVLALACFAAGLLGFFVAAVAWVASGARTVAARLFIALNVCTGIWAFTVFVQLTLAQGVDPSVHPVGSSAWALWILMLLGICGTTLFWFLFAAAQAHRADVLYGWPMYVAVAWALYSVIAGGSNPVHFLFATQSAPNTDVVFGPLAYPHLAFSLVLAAWGGAIIVLDLWNRGHAAHRATAIAVMIVVVAGLVTTALWSLKGAIGLHVPVPLTPVIMPFITAILGWAALYGGLGGIAPLANSRPWLLSESPAITVDDRVMVLAMNTAAEQVVSPDAIGRRLEEFLPAAAAQATDAMASPDGYRMFEHQANRRVYWGRAMSTKSGSAHLGCLVTLDDITEDPSAQLELRRLLGHSIPDAAHGVLSPDVRSIIDQP